jgi:hypothetical protein
MAETAAAQGTGGRRRAAAPAGDGKPEQPRKPTKRTVLRRERVLVLPEGIDDAALAEVVKAIPKLPEKKLADALKAKPVEAWVVIGEFEGTDKEDAIEAHAGKKNTPDAKPGAYKAPPASGWSGGLLYERPPEPKVEVKALD